MMGKKKWNRVVFASAMVMLIFLVGLMIIIYRGSGESSQVLKGKSTNMVSGQEGTLNIKLLRYGGSVNDRFKVTVTINDKEYSGNAVIDGKTQKVSKGILSLKGGQTAEISQISSGSSYKLVANPEISYNTRINGEKTLELEGAFENSSAVKTVVFSNVWKTGSINLKNLNKGGEPGEVFQYTVKIAGELYNGPARMEGRDIQVKDGVIWLQDSQTAGIKDIPFGTSYEITEREDQEYTTVVENLETYEYSGIVSGQNPAPVAVFENIRKGKRLTYSISKIPKRKMVQIFTSKSQGAVYLKVTDGKGKPVEGARYQLFARGQAKGMIAESWEAYTEDCEDGIFATGYNGYVVIRNLPANDYYLEELKGSEGYEFAGKRYVFTIDMEK